MSAILEIPVGIILTQANLPQGVPYHCMRCTTYMFTANRDMLTISVGLEYPVQEIPAGMGWLRLTCRRCRKPYNLYWQ